MKNPSQVNLTAVGGKPRAHDWLLLVNPPPLMLQFFFPRRFNGNHCLYYEKCIVNSICNRIQFRLLLDQSINLFIYFLKLREVFKGWQKCTMKQNESCRTFFLLKVYQKWNQKHREVLPWMAWSEIQVESLFRCSPLQDVINFIKLVRFRSNHEKLECNHQTSKIQICPIRNKQTNVFLKTPQTSDRKWMQT